MLSLSASKLIVHKCINACEANGFFWVTAVLRNNKDQMQQINTSELQQKKKKKKASKWHKQYRPNKEWVAQ